MFLSLLISVVALLQLIPLRGRHLIRSVRSLMIAGAIATMVSGAYLLPYAAASKRVGTRTKAEVTIFSARPRDYLAVTPSNLLYRRHEGVPERRLFPGILPLLLALTGLLLVPPTTVTIAYVLGLVLAFELSLGSFGVLYPALYDSVPVFRALRAPARASVFVLFFSRCVRGPGDGGPYDIVVAATPLGGRRDRLRGSDPGVLGGAARPSALLQQSAATVCLSRTSSPRRGRRVSHAEAHLTAPPRIHASCTCRRFTGCRC